MSSSTPLSLQERGLAILGGFDRARRTVAAGIEGSGGLGSAEVRRAPPSKSPKFTRRASLSHPGDVVAAAFDPHGTDVTEE